MSFQGFVIHTDTDENQSDPALRKTKREDALGKPPATKRAALGTITNTTRVQPARAAKPLKQSLNAAVPLCPPPEGLKENVCAKGPNVQPMAKLQPFTIHVDNKENFKPKQASLQLQPSIPSLQPALSQHEKPVDESPMNLDTTFDQHTFDHSSSKSEEVSISEQVNAEMLISPEYYEEISSYIREAELRKRPKPGYMAKQPEVTNDMRSILIDWLVEVAEEYRLLRETLFLAVNYIDRFLSKMSIVKSKLQLVGTACIFLASKYQEIYPPDVGEFVYITDDTYNKRQVLRMEELVLKALSFDVSLPTANLFCENFLSTISCKENDEVYSSAMYLCELSMIDADPFLRFLPSQIAAGAVCLANHMQVQEPWPLILVEATKYKYEDIVECVQSLYAALIRAPNHPQQAVREKYKLSKFKGVSQSTPPASMPYESFGMSMLV